MGKGFLDKYGIEDVFQAASCLAIQAIVIAGCSTPFTSYWVIPSIASAIILGSYLGLISVYTKGRKGVTYAFQLAKDEAAKHVTNGLVVALLGALAIGWLHGDFILTGSMGDIISRFNTSNVGLAFVIGLMTAIYADMVKD